MAEQWVTRTVTPVLHGRSVVDDTPVEMLEAQFTSKGPQSWRKWDVCVMCNFSYPEEELIYIGGRPYCIKFEHYKDVPGTGGIKDAGG